MQHTTCATGRRNSNGNGNENNRCMLDGTLFGVSVVHVVLVVEFVMVTHAIDCFGFFSFLGQAFLPFPPSRSPEFPFLAFVFLPPPIGYALLSGRISECVCVQVSECMSQRKRCASFAVGCLGPATTLPPSLFSPSLSSILYTFLL